MCLLNARKTKKIGLSSFKTEKIVLNNCNIRYKKTTIVSGNEFIYPVSSN